MAKRTKTPLKRYDLPSLTAASLHLGRALPKRKRKTAKLPKSRGYGK